MVARDDLDDGGADRGRDRPGDPWANAGRRGRGAISDLKGSADDLATICDAHPEVLNHNIETVPRLERAVRPSAGRRSLALLAGPSSTA
ncbi:MAG: hypothetical protein R2710_11270 [Acidimicrobiales bacterium]